MITAILILWLPAAFLAAHIFGRIARGDGEDDGSFLLTVPYPILCHSNNQTQAAQ